MEILTWQGINRNIVECKGQVRSGSNRCPHVLIETSWNVKQYNKAGIYAVVSINRNIVECKVQH